MEREANSIQSSREAKEAGTLGIHPNTAEISDAARKVRQRTRQKRSGNNSEKRMPRLAVNYRHLRQACPANYFRNIVLKGDEKDYFCFISLENKEKLAVRIITPILKAVNKMNREKPVEIQILFNGESITKWRRRVFWKGDGRRFLEEFHEAVGRALRLQNSERIFAVGDTELTIMLDERGNQQLFNQKGDSRSIRTALLD